MYVGLYEFDFRRALFMQSVPGIRYYAYFSTG